MKVEKPVEPNNKMETLLITKLTIKSYLQIILLKKLYGQNTIYNNFFINRKELLLLIKKKNLISIEKIHSIRNIYI